jgi:hypothetical protein
VKRPTIRRPTPATIIAGLALAVALTGTGYAASRIPANSVGTKQLKNNAVTSAKVKNGSLGAADFKAGTLLKGDKGDPGTPGADATNLWAVLNPDGTLNRGSHVVSSGKVDYSGTTGSYEVIFDRDVTNCVYMGTLGGANTVLSQGQITTFPRNNNVDGVFIFTYDDAGVRADRLFQVAVLC